jgi:hypothetical protein
LVKACLFPDEQAAVRSTSIPVPEATLANKLPSESEALVIRDGLMLKGCGPKIQILEDDRLRWISSLDAFEHLRLTWEDVHVEASCRCWLLEILHQAGRQLVLMADAPGVNVG